MKMTNSKLFLDTAPDDMVAQMIRERVTDLNFALAEAQVRHLEVFIQLDRPISLSGNYPQQLAVRIMKDFK